MKSTSIRVRLTEQEKIILKQKSDLYKMSISDYVKFCCLINPPKNVKGGKCE